MNCFVCVLSGSSGGAQAAPPRLAPQARAPLGPGPTPAPAPPPAHAHAHAAAPQATLMPKKQAPTSSGKNYLLISVSR